MTNKYITTESVQLSKSKQNADPIASIRHPIALRRILAPTDLSPDGKKAVEYAIALAEHFSSEVTILHVYPAPGFNDYPRPTDGESVANIFRENAQNALDSFRSEIKQEYPRIDGLLRCGKPEEEIVRAAKDLEIDLIVLSTHNYQWFSHLIHGSDAEGVLRHAPCPMLVVRKEEHDFIDAN
jgi:universal stress protein A